MLLNAVFKNQTTEIADPKLTQLIISIIEHIDDMAILDDSNLSALELIFVEIEHEINLYNLIKPS